MIYNVGDTSEQAALTLHIHSDTTSDLPNYTVPNTRQSVRRARAPHPLPARPKAGHLHARLEENASNTVGEVAWLAGERSRHLWSVESGESAASSPMCGPTRGETRGEGALAARGRCGGVGAP